MDGATAENMATAATVNVVAFIRISLHSPLSGAGKHTLTYRPPRLVLLILDVVKLPNRLVVKERGQLKLTLLARRQAKARCKKPGRFAI